MINKLLVIGSWFVVFLFLPTTNYQLLTTDAHLAGQPPYFKVNGEYANLYSVPVSSLYDFNLPQDLAPGNYLVGQKLNFELDKLKLPAPQEIVAKTNFTWKFGDGGIDSGLVLSHSYNKMGSYILDVYADDGTTPTPQLLEKILINIVPDKNYQIPQSKIFVNGNTSKDSLTDILQLKFGDLLQFDGNKSTGKIDSYFWDFGDQSSGNDRTISHQYPKDLTQVFVVLRVKDNNGFISDSFLEVQNADLTGGNVLSNLGKSAAVNKSNTPSQLKYTLIGLVVLVGIIFGIKKFR